MKVISNVINSIWIPKTIWLHLAKVINQWKCNLSSVFWANAKIHAFKTSFKIKYCHFKSIFSIFVLFVSFLFKLFPLTVKSLKYDINTVLIPNIYHSYLLLSQKACQDIENKWNWCEQWLFSESRLWSILFLK
jgi:hypothetical protein